MKSCMFIFFVISSFSVAGQEWKKSIDIMLDSLEETNTASVSVGVMHQATLYNRSIGYADIEKEVLATSNTKYRIASLTKQFVGHAIKELTYSNRLDLEDEVSKYLPEIEIPDLQVRHLVSHQSGLPEYWPLEQLLSRDFAERANVVKAIGDLNHTNFSPGDFHQYCNTNYVLLYEIIDRVSNLSASSFIKRKVFDSYGMANSFIPEENKPIPNFATRYHFEDGKYEIVNNKMSSIVGDGGMVTTLEDMMKYASKIMSSSQTYEHGYEYGLFSSGEGYLEHGGGSKGVSTFIIIDRTNQFLTVVLSNSDRISAEAIAKQVQSALKLDQDVDVVKSQVKDSKIEISGKWFGFINGTPGILELNVNPKGGLLKSNNREFELINSKSNIYKFKVAPVKLVFNNKKDMALLYAGNNVIGQIEKLITYKESMIIKNGIYRSSHDGILNVSNSEFLTVNGNKLEQLSENLYNNDVQIYRFSSNGMTLYSNMLWDIRFISE